MGNHQSCCSSDSPPGRYAFDLSRLNSSPQKISRFRRYQYEPKQGKEFGHYNSAAILREDTSNNLQVTPSPSLQCQPASLGKGW